jgi:hypothetical protein
MVPPRVAVIGGGISGALVSRCLLASGISLSVTLFEMGRGFGGRMATRRPQDPELAGLAINHGAPAFGASTPFFQSIVAELEAAGVVQRFAGAVGTLHVDSSDGSLTAFEAGQLARPAEWAGIPGMSAICDHLGRGAETRFGTMVAQIERSSAGVFTLTDQKGERLGEFERIVVTSHTLAHSRFERVFGRPAPLQALAREADSAQLSRLVELIEQVPSTPVMAMLLAFSPADAPALAALPFAAADVRGSALISKVVVQSAPSGHIALVVHSTPAFAAEHADVHGSSSTAARMGAAAGRDNERDLTTQLLAELGRLLRPFGELPLAPAYGPLIHRWGSAFPEESSPASSLALVDAAARVSEELGITVCGDFIPVAPSTRVQLGSVESAALCAMLSAERLVDSFKPRKKYGGK